MKRYTKEFLHAEMIAAKEDYNRTNNIIFIERIAELTRIERAVVRGLITDFEAIKTACQIIERE